MTPATKKTISERVASAARVARSSASRYPRELARSVMDRMSASGVLASAAGTDQPAFDVPVHVPLAAAWLGHASVLLRIGGKWVLTDPVFSNRIGLRLGAMTVGVERFAPPPVPIDALPPIDLVLISHAHFDHLDRPTLRRLARRYTTVVTAARTKRLIPSGYREVIELPWDERARVLGLDLHALRPRHWGARTVWDRHRGYNSYLIEGGHDAARPRVLYAGDTAMTDAFEGVRGRHGPLDLSIFGIGAYDPWEEAHATPEQVWSMHERAGGRFLLPIHHSTFKLSNEPVHEPLHRLKQAAGQHAHRVVDAPPGRLWRIPEGSF